MVQYNLPRERKRPEPQGPQVAGLVSGAAKEAPQLAKHLADWLFNRGVDPRDVYKQTGYIEDPTTGELVYSFADQGMKLREDNPLLALPEATKPSASYIQPDPARMYEQPGIPMKEGDAGYKTQGGNTRARYGFRGQTKPGEELLFTGPGSDPPPGLPPLISMRQPVDPAQLDFLEVPGTSDAGFTSPGMMDPRRSNQPRTPKFGEMFSHPLQEEFIPELADIPIEARYRFGGPQDYSGQYSGDVPRDVSKASARAEGPQGGVDVLNSMPSVALHEVGAHGGQNQFGWARGGSQSENWMTERGNELRRMAAQRQTELINQKASVIDQLVGQGAIDRDAAMDLYDELYPGTWDRMNQYRDTEAAAVRDPKYTAYQHEAGEAAGRNFQTRAADLTTDVPMTDTHWKGTKRHEGDVHPLETYDVAPDLTRSRVVTQAETPLAPKEVTISDLKKPAAINNQTYYAESQPIPMQYDWLLKKAPAAGAAAAVATAAGAGEAGAAENDKRDRLTQQTTPKTSRLPGPARDAQMASMAETPSMLATSMRENLEEGLGMAGDFQEWVGAGPSSRFPQMPTSEDITRLSKAAQEKLPPWIQSLLEQYTQAEPRSPGAHVAKSVADWTLDPIDLLLGGAGKAAKAMKGLF